MHFAESGPTGSDKLRQAFEPGAGASKISAMLFKSGFHRGIVDGSITRTFRRWKRLQVVVGNRYTQPFGEVEVVSAKEVNEASISERDARLAGYDSRDDLLAELAKYPDGTLYRIDFRFAGADRRIALREKDDLSEADIDALVKRLERLDKASSHGPWTRQALELIDRKPAVVSTVLAAEMGLDRPAFKIDIRKLKESGLTESLDVGYRLSPRGKRLLAHLRTRQ
jgi:hypothetical protein